MGRAWSLEFADADGVAGSLRLAIPDDDAAATFTARVTLPGEGVVVVHDDEVPPPRGAQLVVRAEGLWAELLCETPGEHWSFGLDVKIMIQTLLMPLGLRAFDFSDLLGEPATNVRATG